MKITGKQSALRQTYFRNFIILIVIPLVLVFIGAEFIVGHMVRSSSIETIDAHQSNIATVLSNDVKTYSLQLSHFIYSEDGDFLKNAVRVYNASGNDWYYADRLLHQDFNTAMVPSQKVLAGGFYMKQGGAVYVKDNIIVPESQIRSSSWYSDALDNPNVITIGCFDTSRIRLTGSDYRRDQLVLVTALAPNMLTDRSGEIELVAFFTESQASDVINSQNKSSDYEQSVILNSDGQVLFGDMGNETLNEYFAENHDKFLSGSRTERVKLLSDKKRPYYFKSKPIPNTDWTVVTVVDESRLGQSFYPVGGLLLFTVVILLVLFYMFSRYFLNAIVAPIHAVSEAMSKLDSSDLNVYVEPTGEQEIRNLIVSFNEMVQSINNLLRMTEETTQKKHEAEIQALQRQINPHFIVNTLNSIRFMAEVAKFDGIRKMAESLVSIVSCSFTSNASFYSIADELEILRTYVYIMRIRYSNGFDVYYDVAEDCFDYQIPRLMLQPIVENSITHGFDNISEALGEIKVSVYTDKDFLSLEVLDNGRGMSKEQVELLLSGKQPPSDGSGIGIENVRERLRLHFGERAGIIIESEPEKFTRTILRIPLSMCKMKGDN